MTRKSLAHIRSHEEQSLDDAWRWFTTQRRLIIAERIRALDSFARSGSSVPRTDQTFEEFDAGIERQIFELNYLAMFSMLASTEAALRIDFVVRVDNRKKDRVSRAYRDAFKHRGIRKVRLEED